MLRNPKKEWGRKKREKKKEVNEYRVSPTNDKLALWTKALGYTHTHVHAQYYRLKPQDFHFENNQCVTNIYI